MLCSGNTMTMCGMCDMGRKSFFCRTNFFSTPLSEPSCINYRVEPLFWCSPFAILSIRPSGVHVNPTRKVRKAPQLT